MLATKDIGALIHCRPQVRGGRPLIAGTGVSVQRIIGWYKLGASLKEIAENSRNGGCKLLGHRDLRGGSGNRQETR